MVKKCGFCHFWVIFWGRKKVQKQVTFSARRSWRVFKNWSRRAKKTWKSWFRILRTGCCASGCWKSMKSYKSRFLSTWEGNSGNRQNRVFDWKNLKSQRPSNKGSVDKRLKILSSWSKSSRAEQNDKKHDFEPGQHNQQSWFFWKEGWKIMFLQVENFAFLYFLIGFLRILKRHHEYRRLENRTFSKIMFRGLKTDI